jgi:hypothetical protein
VDKAQLNFNLNLIGTSIFLPNGEPFSAEEAMILRDSLDRYLNELGETFAEQSSVAYDRFIAHIAPSSDDEEKPLSSEEEEEEDGPAPRGSNVWHEYGRRKQVRNERLTAVGEWSLQFEDEATRERAAEINRLAQEQSERLKSD